ncbi:MAG TPA: hypothetical protein VKM72_28410 [Thermoanaerobaculia bacterium]|nr:hypothetical protein [Thermoanaerobaculia bacterium]
MVMSEVAYVAFYGFFVLEAVDGAGAVHWLYKAPYWLSYQELTEAMLAEAGRYGLSIRNHDPARRYFLFDAAGDPVFFEGEAPRRA